MAVSLFHISGPEFPSQSPGVIWASASASNQSSSGGEKCAVHSQELPSMVLPIRDNQGCGFLGASSLSEGPLLLLGSGRQCP